MRTHKWMAAAGLALAALNGYAGYNEGMNALATRDYAKARAEFEAERDNPKSLYQLARMARLGLGEARDETRAVHLLAAASELGHPESQVDYVYALGNGRGVAKDAAKAMQLLRGLADRGNAEGQVTLGKVLRFGWWDQPKDEARAAALFEKAMQAGDDNGRALFALALMDGAGVPKDEARGAQLLREGAERGHLDSQLEYARMLTFGAGIAKDEVAGVEWYRKAAEKADRTAQYGLGMAYLRGRGVARDESAAVRWLDASARQGLAFAQLQLGDLFRLGQGVPRMRSEAYTWYTIAAASTTPAAVERANALRAEMARELGEADIAKYVKRAQAFQAQPGFVPRQTPLPPLARGDRVSVGSANLTIPLPSGYVNGWELAEGMQRAYPNDTGFRPLLMVLNSREDMDRIKLGVSGQLRGIEVARHAPDDAMAVTAKLFTEIKGQLRSQVEANVAGGRYRLEGTVRDDDRVYAIIRSGLADANRLDGVALILVKEKVLSVAIVGFTPAQKEEVAALLKGVADEIVSANRPSLFSQ